MFKKAVFLLGFILCSNAIFAQPAELSGANVVWHSQSKNTSESMPCGGGDIGLNVWVENGDLYFYIAQSGAFDENNAFLKAGRVKLQLSPNPFQGKNFKQELVLKDGYVKINGGNGKLNAEIQLWVDVFHPMIHIELKTTSPVKAIASFESWRDQDRQLNRKENNANSWKWASHISVITKKDSIEFNNNQVLFYHQNSDSTVFDATVKQEGLDQIKSALFNPIKARISGGIMQGNGMVATGNYQGISNDIAFKGWRIETPKAIQSQSIEIGLLNGQFASINQWKDSFNAILHQHKNNAVSNLTNTRNWWHQYWNRSFVFINPQLNDSSESWQAGRNYQLFRYMLGCNAFGKYPTKFNGGLFTTDPIFTDSSIHGTPDHRNWGGGLFTAQNQRLVYWPMLKSGDVDLMKPQFDFYLTTLKNAELRTKFYWNHTGASFTEQLENFGLPNVSEYGWKRPTEFDKGMEYNSWLEYCWDTVLEFCLMILESEKYEGNDIKTYLPLIESSLVFFDEHYQWLAKKRGIKALDENGKLILYPGSAAETFKMTTNATSTIAGLQTVTKALLSSGHLDSNKQKYFTTFLQRIPNISFGNAQGHPVIAPAKSWERVNNTESPQLYPVFPWNIYGVGKAGLDTAINTWRFDSFTVKFRSHIGWKQDNIFAAKLGLTNEAAILNVLKMKNSGRRFPAFWGPGYDWVPDHNWGGSGMIGIQEMLLQTDDKKIFLFPAWPKNWDIHLKLHAPYQTTVEAIIKNGKLTYLEVIPKERMKDVINLY